VENKLKWPGGRNFPRPFSVLTVLSADSVSALRVDPEKRWKWSVASL